MNLRSKVKRPIMRYHGGKWLLAPWIISHMPDHRIYVEPYGGAASVLLQKKRTYSEIYNDLDGDIVNVFMVVRDNGELLKNALQNTPFSREEFELSYQESSDPIERARRTIVRSFMGFGSAAATATTWGVNSKGFRTKGNYSGQYGKPNTGFRASSNRSGTTPAHDWRNYPKMLDRLISRLQGVVIENRCALKVMSSHDTEHTLHYVDPPYVLQTRHRGELTKSYKFEMSNKEHVDLCEFLKSLKGTVMISGYSNEIYDDLLNGWGRIERQTYADGAKKRNEALWINNPQLKNVQTSLGF